MATVRSAFLFVLAGALFFVFAGALAAEPPDPAAIMREAAARNVAATEARRQFVYNQKVRASLIGDNDQLARREIREYSVVPQESSTGKTLSSFSGEYRYKGKLIPYTQLGAKDQGSQVDRSLIQELTSQLVDAKGSRDGIPRDLFPLRTADLPYYRFSLKGETAVSGRMAWDILFEPASAKEVCIHVGSVAGSENAESCHEWKGEVWIDEEDNQPARVTTELARGVPWGVKVFLGTNVKQLGFIVTYQRVAPNVWFPATYGTEFHVAVLWGYRRTITLSLESSQFRRTAADSTVHFDPQEATRTE